MKKLVKLLSFMLLLGAMFGVTKASAETEDFIVKVKLIQNLGGQASYYFEPQGDSVLKERTDVILTKGKKYKIEMAAGQLAIKDGTKTIADKLTTVTIAPKVYAKENFLLVYRGDKAEIAHPYMGTMHFRIEGTTPKIQPVNHLMFEDYLKGVLPGETPAYWGSQGGMEALKAQAIAARSYVFAKAQGNMTIEINDTTTYQVFKGFIWDPISPKYYYTYENTNKAVDETAGKIMTYKRYPNSTKDYFVTSFFSSSNGGQTELPQQYWSTSLPYITESKVDEYDIGHTDWEIAWLKQQLDPALDKMQPEGWWNTVGEKGLAAGNMPHPNDAVAFTKLKAYALAELKKQDSTIESIKIASIDSMVKDDYDNTGKVEEITTNFSYYTRHKSGTNLVYDMIPGAQSETLSGTTRYDTAVEIAREYVGTEKAATIVLGRGDVPADALAGTVLAHKHNAPIMLVRNNAIPESVETFIKEKVQPGAKIYLLGGTFAISAEMEASLKNRGFAVERVSGKDRTGTSIAIAKEVNSAGSEIMVATGNDDSSDALSASAYAAAKQIPIIIHRGAKTAAQTKDYLKETGTSAVTLIGGNTVIPETVETELAADYAVDRISGASRVDTSLAINQQLPLNGTNIVIGNAYSFIDSLAGSVLAAKTGSPIVLLHPDAAKLPHEFFNGLPVKNQAYFLGGSLVVSADLKTAVNEYIAGELNKKKMSLTFKGSNRDLYPKTMVDFRTMLGAGVLKSVDFNLVNHKDRIIMDGAGFGHGIGMSQHGAFARSKDGHLAEAILKFYYDGIEIKTRDQIVK